MFFGVLGLFMVFYSLILWVLDKSAELEHMSVKEHLASEWNEKKKEFKECWAILRGWLKRLIVFLTPPSPRYVFGEELRAGFMAVIEQYRFAPFAADLWQDFRDNLPCIYISFVQRSAFTDELATEVLLHITETFRRYLLVKGLPFSFVPYRYYDGAKIEIYIYYAENVDDLQRLKQKRDEIVRLCTTPGFGKLEEKLPVPKRGAELTIGYEADAWKISGKKVPITVNLKTTPHLMIAGTTGGGKSVLGRVIVSKLLKRGAAVSICDFKGGEDWRGFTYAYAKGDGCAALFEEFYTTFMKIRATGKPAPRPYVLVIDEFQSFATSYQTTAGAKAFAEFMKKLSDIALMGRSFDVHLILLSQQFNAKCIDTAIREQFGVRVYLGRKISSETAQMLFPGCEIDKGATLPKYHGYVSTPDDDIKEIAIPEIVNLKEFDSWFLEEK